MDGQKLHDDFMADKEFSIVTYQITDDGKVEEIDTIFMLEKTAEAKEAASAAKRAFSC